MPTTIFASSVCPVCTSVLRAAPFSPKSARTLIRNGRKRLGMTEAAFASAVGVTRSAVQQWERADGTAPSRQSAPRVARALGMSLDAFLTGGPRPVLQVERVQSVPIVSNVEAGGFRKIDNFKIPSALERISVTVEVRQHTFALKVHGDSMCSAGPHSFPEGTIIVVEPDLTPEAGDFVVALNDQDEATFKQLVREDGAMLLRPLNRRFKAYPLGSSRIIGVVREAIWRFR